MVKLDRGRRVELADPGRSLILAKPSGAIPHKGGVRFATDSREYRILADWIAAGAAPPSDADPRVERAGGLARRLDPPRRRDPADRRPRPLQRRPRRGRHPLGEMVVGRRVGLPRGRRRGCHRGRPGRGGRRRLVRQQDRDRADHGPVPGSASRPTDGGEARRPAEAPELHRRADRQAARPAEPARLAGLRRRRVPPPRLRSTRSAGCRPPTRSGTSSPIPSPGKRDALIDALLARPEFADYWTYKWSDVLTLTQHAAPARGAEGVLHLGSRARRRQHAVGPVRARDPPRDGRQPRERRHQLLRPQPVARGHDRERVPGVPRALDRLRQVPQPPAREMDQRPVLRHGQPVRAGAGQGLGRRRRRRATAGGRST